MNATHLFFVVTRKGLESEATPDTGKFDQSDMGWEDEEIIHGDNGSEFEVPDASAVDSGSSEESGLESTEAGFDIDDEGLDPDYVMGGMDEAADDEDQLYGHAVRIFELPGLPSNPGYVLQGIADGVSDASDAEEPNTVIQTGKKKKVSKAVVYVNNIKLMAYHQSQHVGPCAKKSLILVWPQLWQGRKGRPRMWAT